MFLTGGVLFGQYLYYDNLYYEEDLETDKKTCIDDFPYEQSCTDWWDEKVKPRFVWGTGLLIGGGVLAGGGLVWWQPWTADVHISPATNGFLISGRW